MYNRIFLTKFVEKSQETMKRTVPAGSGGGGTVNDNNNGSSTVSSSSGPPVVSFHRRRGTSGWSGKISLHSSWQSPLLLLAIIAITMTIGMFLLFIIYHHQPMSNTTTRISNKGGGQLRNLPGVPNLLRGNIEPIRSDKKQESQQRRQENIDNIAAASAKVINKKDKIDLDLYDSIPTKLYPYSLEPVLETYSIENDYKVLGGNRFIEYTTGGTPYVVTDEMKQQSNKQAKSRRKYIKQSMEFVWSNYVKSAFGMDELQPSTGKGSNGWGGQGITLVDALDTLWLMNMKKEFYQARDWVRDHLDHSKTSGMVSAFETTIRDLAGLLSAYDWSGDKVFLEKAVDLGERLLKCFDGSSTGIPYGQIDFNNGRVSNVGWAGNNAILAEFGTQQIEFNYLAKASNRPELAEKTNKVFEIMNEISPPNGLYPYFYKNNGPGLDKPKPANNKLTFGAMADSFYEYMLKLWIQTDKTIPMYREMYDKAMDGMFAELLQKSKPSGLTYIADKNNDNLDTKMDHLVCFMGGLLALGAYTDPNGLESDRAQRDLRAGKALTYTCYQMYARMNTGISAEYVQFQDGTDFQIGRGAPHYLLRPEAVESMFILNQLTGDPIYREWGWEIYQSIEKYCKTNFGYGSLNNVQDTHGKPRDKMESFFLAETLKYLYLLQDPDTPVDVLHTHVFNTEAHPLRIFSKMDQPAQPVISTD